MAEGKVVLPTKTKVKIQPGESLSDFRRRVDREIPVKMGSMNREPRKKKRKKEGQPVGQPVVEEEEKKR
jgi:hypothetical protein